MFPWGVGKVDPMFVLGMPEEDLGGLGTGPGPVSEKID